MLEVGLTFSFVQLLERKIEQHLELLLLWLPSIRGLPSLSLFVLPLESFPSPGEIIEKPVNECELSLSLKLLMVL